MFEVTADWERRYPEALVGVLVTNGVKNPRRHPELEESKQALEQELRERYSSHDRKSLRRLPALAAYHEYYRGFGKTYHIQHQLESIVFKGKSIPAIAALVEAMFMAELTNLLLTAGHDLNAIDLPLRIGVASGNETYVRLDGQEQALKAGDMMISDRAGVVSSILYGPDKRSRIGPDTKSAVFTVYAPAGIARPAVRHHLEDILSNVRVVSPQATAGMMEVFGTASSHGEQR